MDLRFAKFITLDYGQYKKQCPACEHERKNKADRPLSIKVDHEGAVYNCHHCNISGKVFRENMTKAQTKTNIAPPNITKPVVIPEVQSSEEAEKFLKDRGIDITKAVDWGCRPTIKKGSPVLAFVYDNKGAKYRSTDEKRFWFEGENQYKLWGTTKKEEEVPHLEDTIIITEGELDTLAIKTAFQGHFTLDCFSVPNGANAKVKHGEIDPNEDGRFKYVWNDKEKFEGKERIILATDNDEAGHALREELSRRLGIARCYVVDYSGDKDSNDMLINQGKEALRSCILGATPMPLKYLRNVDDYADEMDNLYNHGNPKGVTTGYPELDDLFTLKKESLVVVTGMPNSGKSNFVTQLTYNVAKNFGWKTCFCSFEMPPSLHAVQISQMYTNKPFFTGQTQRMSDVEKLEAQHFIKDHFLFMDFKEGADIDSIIESANQAVQRMGCRILVVDPFNYIARPNNKIVTDEVSDMLTKLNVFAKEKGVLVFFVCHPAKPMDRTKKFVPTGLDISHSMSFFAKADLGITVARGDNPEHSKYAGVEIHCWKSRYYWLGRQGMKDLRYNKVTGVYSEYETQRKENFNWEI